MPAAALIGALGGIASGLANQSIGNAMNLRAQKELYNYTLPREQGAQYNMIKMSPQLQVEGMKAAGLNPASITGGYQGAGASGDASANTQPLNMDVLNGAQVAQQMELNALTTKANLKKTEAEANYINKQANRYDELTDVEIRAKQAAAALQEGQNSRESELQNYAVKQAIQNLDLGQKDLDFKRITNDALEKEYDFNGVKVKGSEIPNFEKLLSLQIALETMKYNWSVLAQRKREFEGDPQKLLTDKFLVPMVDYLQKHFPELKDTVIQKLTEFWNNLPTTDSIIDGIMNRGIDFWLDQWNRAAPSPFQVHRKEK